MRIRTELLSVVINAHVRIRQHVHRGHYIEGHIGSIALIFSLNINLFYFQITMGNNTDIELLSVKFS